MLPRTDASKALYKGHKLNDALTKIITQKYIANTPYGVVEMWNDRRRLGLPFFEVPGAETVLTGSDMDNAKTYDPQFEQIPLLFRIHRFLCLNSE